MASVDEAMLKRDLRSYHHSMHDLIEAMLELGKASHAMTMRLLLARDAGVTESMLIAPGLKWVEQKLKETT